jgi:hypothetical protein
MSKLHGHHLVVGGSDAGFLSAGSKSGLERLRAYFQISPPAQPGALPPERPPWPKRGGSGRPHKPAKT